MKILMWAQKLQTRDWFDPRPSESDSVTSTEALTTWPLQPYYQLSINRSYLNKFYFGVRAIEINQKSKVPEKVNCEDTDYSGRKAKRSSRKNITD